MGHAVSYAYEALTRSKRPRWITLEAAGYWFLFFATIYAILLVKIVTGSYVNESIFFGVYSVTITLYIFSRFVLAYLHRSVAIDLRYEPSVAFVVPTKNEEVHIGKTIHSFARVAYPLSKVEVILIDDGSTDGTLAQMHKAAAEIRSLVGHVEVVHFAENKGKRYGMAEGIKRSTHDVVIFVDSDSLIEPDAVRHLVKYFADPSVGAVSGHTDVSNRTVNMLTQMQALRYYIAFKIYKAAESIFGNVTCCPGCCSAYRRSYLMEFVDPWLHQTFLGKECTFGDDRSLTNFIIRKYRAAYSAEAIAYTAVPETFGVYARQQQRWKKSWIRETFIAASFFWRKNPIAAAFFYAYVFLAFAGPVVFIHALIWNPLVHSILPWVYLMGLLLMLTLHGVYYRLQVGQRPWFWAVVSFWFYSVVLMWQLPWALLTIADTRWGTR